MDIVRVLRIIEYVGPRNLVEEHLVKTVNGEMRCHDNQLIIRAATIGRYPEILDAVADGKTEVAEPEAGRIGGDCSICGAPQIETPLGTSCVNGHGGALPLWAVCRVDHSQYVGKCPSCHVKLPTLSQRDPT